MNKIESMERLAKMPKTNTVKDAVVKGFMQMYEDRWEQVKDYDGTHMVDYDSLDVKILRKFIDTVKNIKSEEIIDGIEVRRKATISVISDRYKDDILLEYYFEKLLMGKPGLEEILEENVQKIDAAYLKNEQVKLSFLITEKAEVYADTGSVDMTEKILKFDVIVSLKIGFGKMERIKIENPCWFSLVKVTNGSWQSPYEIEVIGSYVLTKRSAIMFEKYFEHEKSKR